MVKRTLLVRNKNGLHARVAALVAEECLRFESDISLCRGYSKANGCSVIEMLLLAAKEGSEVEVAASGTDEADAIDAIADIFENGGGI